MVPEVLQGSTSSKTGFKDWFIYVFRSECCTEFLINENWDTDNPWQEVVQQLIHLLPVHSLEKAPIPSSAK